MTQKTTFSRSSNRKMTDDFHESKIKRMLGNQDKMAEAENRSGHVTSPIVTDKESQDLVKKKGVVSGEARALSTTPRATRGNV